MINKSATLPDKPSALIRVAIADLKKAEAANDVLIDMHTFYSRYYGADLEGTHYDKPLNNKQKYCCVCLAGTVMIGSLGGATDDDSISTDSWGIDIQKKLYALDYFRMGGVLHGIREMGLFNEKDVTKIIHAFEPVDLEDDNNNNDEYSKVNVSVPKYESGKEEFKSRLLYIADRLESVGY